MYKGNIIELNALGESCRCRKCQKKKKMATACSGRDKRFLVAIECRKCQEQATAGFGRRQGIPGRDRVLSGFCAAKGITVS